MSELKRRYIVFIENGQTHQVPAYSKVIVAEKYLSVRFTFEKDLSVTDIENVTVDNEGGYINMVTSRGNDFTAGALYDQLLLWFQDMETRWKAASYKS
ncbi:hypothetical protein [Mucilaginibacter sp. UYCu711]|uniref:hypothetical protein n=1 Tax=Mucilaginibacter sp. UYCu711 TaxID=3156339 RepID=UPI003D2416B8